MADTRSGLANRKHTLLHYLVELVLKKFKQLDSFDLELKHVEEGAKG